MSGWLPQGVVCPHGCCVTLSGYLFNGYLCPCAGMIALPEGCWQAWQEISRVRNNGISIRDLMGKQAQNRDCLDLGLPLGID